MLFNSFNFIFIFLPLILLTVSVTRSHSLSLTHTILILASILFYSFLDLVHLPVLIFSAIVNYALGMVLIRYSDKGMNTHNWLIVGIVFNLILLGGYKYIGFAAQIVGFEVSAINAPLGVSFFTFHQLAYLVDIHRKRIRPTNIRDYFLYVTFFPHLIAGPIMRYGQFTPQLSAPISPIAYGAGIFFFSVGLFKKTVLADTFAPIADRIFSGSATEAGVIWIEAWKGALAYTWQIYFDFSGYADMAIGIGLLLGIALPINFLSPYKAYSMVDFWRRWHITLSQFLRDYVYIPLGGSRHGRVRQMCALILTMALAGLWHGASWNFVMWGTLHGALLVVVHGWNAGLSRHVALPRFIAIGLTFSAVVLLWVLFRAETWKDAMRYYHVMSTLTEITFPQKMTIWLTDSFWREWIWITAGGLVVFTFKPTGHWVEYNQASPVTDRLHTTAWHAIVSGVLLWLAFKAMTGEPSRSFVYFVF